MKGNQSHGLWLRAIAVAATLLLIALAIIFRAEPVPNSDMGQHSVQISHNSAPVLPAMQLQEAISKGKVAGHYQALSRNQLSLRLRMTSSEAIEAVVPAGTVFERGDEQIVLIRTLRLRLAPATETIHSGVTISATGYFSGPGEFFLTGSRISPLAVLLPYAEDHPEISIAVLQTAALVLTENLPLSAFARFKLVAGDSPASPHNDDLKVDNRTIILALRLLKEIGVPMDRVAMNIDPQLLVEAMTDPMAHAEALEFYEIPPGKEWEFWKSYLQYGDQATRHYALHGIGQYFPDVAVNMMAQWAKAPHLDESLRLSAIQALAKTGRIEALSVLAQLRQDLAPDPKLDVALYQSTALLMQSIYDPFHLNLPTEYRLTPPTLRASGEIP